MPPLGTAYDTVYEGDPNLFLKLPSDRLITMPSEIKGGLVIEGLPPLSTPASECGGN